MFCVTQISVFHFGFKYCQVAWGKKKKKKDIKERGWYFQKQTLPHGKVSAPLKCLLVCLSPGAKQSGNCSQHCKIFRLTQIPAFLQLKGSRSPPGSGCLAGHKPRHRWMLGGARLSVLLRSLVGCSWFIFFFFHYRHY